MATYSENSHDSGHSAGSSLPRRLNDPALWSESLIRRTMAPGSVYNILEVQWIIRDYLGVLSEVIRKGERLPVGFLPPSSKTEQKLLVAG